MSAVYPVCVVIGSCIFVVGGFFVLFVSGETTPLITRDHRTKHVSHPVEHTRCKYSDSVLEAQEHTRSHHQSTLAILRSTLPVVQFPTTRGRRGLGPQDPVKAVAYPTSAEQTQRSI